MAKVLHIQDCYFKLPEDFNGTCGNALMLLGLHRSRQEKEQSISNETNNDNRIQDFWASDKKCTMAYCIDDEEEFKNEKEDKQNDNNHNREG